MKNPFSGDIRKSQIHPMTFAQIDEKVGDFFADSIGGIKKNTITPTLAWPPKIRASLTKKRLSSTDTAGVLADPRLLILPAATLADLLIVLVYTHNIHTKALSGGSFFDNADEGMKR